MVQYELRSMYSEVPGLERHRQTHFQDVFIIFDIDLTQQKPIIDTLTHWRNGQFLLIQPSD
jgi:hypothetical protein